MVSLEKRVFQNRWNRLAMSAALRGAGLVLQVPGLRTVGLDMLLRRLGVAYDETEGGSDRLEHIRWLGPHLGAFMNRVMKERPAAARALLRFIGTWIEDLYRRTDIQRAGGATPCTVVIEPTDRCNLHCPGCYAKSTRDGCDLPYERLAEIVQQVVDMGVTLITISGGEPFLRERDDRCLTRLAGQFKNRAFLVYTNGTLIDEAIASELGRVGNIFPAISVEGFEHQTDARRGRGTYCQNRLARRLLAERGVMTGFSATITRENADAICTDEFLDLRIAEGDLFGWFFLMQPIGRAPRADLMVTAGQRARLRETILRWRLENRPIFLGDFWNDGHLVGGCIAGGRYYFHIRASGDISPCVFAPISCGNIFDIINRRTPYASLDDFVQRHPVFQAWRAEQQSIKDRARPCLLLDNPEAFRRIYRAGACQPAKNMAPDYLEGATARAIDATAAEWQQHADRLPDHLTTAGARPESGAAR